MAERFSMGDAAEPISLAEDDMALELVPWDALRVAAARVNAWFEDCAEGRAFGEDTEDRLASLREWIAERMRKRSMVSVVEDGIVLTSGLEQSLEWVVRRLTVSGDAMLVERPTGLAGLSVLVRCGVQVIGVDCDDQGVQVEELERLLAGEGAASVKPRLLYVAPTYGDPTGRVWSLKRRQEVLGLCRAHGVCIIEDDSCGELKFHGDAPGVPTLYALAGEAGGVVYVSSFESIVAPSVQVGWVAGKRTMMVGLGVGTGECCLEEGEEVDSADAEACVRNQLVLAELLIDFDLDAHVRRLADTYRERMYAMQRQLRIQQIAGVTWSEPEGGKFLWLTLPDGLDADALRRLTMIMGVDIAPGSQFYAGEAMRNRVRLCFTGCSVEQIERGIEIVGEAIRDFTGRWSDG
ncbi:2-aminoadipate transaminase [Paenibacillus cellulosilyticus]|uniref:2-aminoadipate transaminase n=1 Tax=Paenibacillus cellulosilyticus TaxID=375489 RepID=A0A2V2YNY5_9BACL|nr:PLP-dependent aminotransferase family protein [Paenibacillus cellulosilyticus]PWV97858.1 2-aminoadipate transaminase [Paenibacillus cellulosilyticus]QKS46970.1 PLP-dependent aminotransferase family protein [Paenibacillus cellulosilyticus]